MPGLSKTSLYLVGVCMAALVCANGAVAELPAENIPNVATLDADYPDSLVFVHDANFHALIAQRLVLVDVAPQSHNYKGALDASQFSSFTNRAIATNSTWLRRFTRVVRAEKEPMFCPFTTKKHWGKSAKSCCPGANGASLS